MSKRDILVLVEGEKTDVSLMEALFASYEIDQRHQLVFYGTSLYALYNSMFKGKEVGDIDLFLHLREHEKDPVKKTLFDQSKRYSEIVLIFDFDPQDREFSTTAIREMSQYFTDSTDTGKLYINYPMVEAFYHVKSIPDSDYDGSIASLAELKNHLYKSRVHQESAITDRKEFVAKKSNCDIVVQQNIDKAWRIVQKARSDDGKDSPVPVQPDILNKQLEKLSVEKAVYILCTCAFYYSGLQSKTDWVIINSTARTYIAPPPKPKSLCLQETQGFCVFDDIFIIY